jgi:hypothetical protein
MRLDRTQLAKAMARARDAPNMFTPTDPEPVPELVAAIRLSSPPAIPSHIWPPCYWRPKEEETSGVSCKQTTTSRKCLCFLFIR